MSNPTEIEIEQADDMCEFLQWESEMGRRITETANRLGISVDGVTLIEEIEVTARRLDELCREQGVSPLYRNWIIGMKMFAQSLHVFGGWDGGPPAEEMLADARAVRENINQLIAILEKMEAAPQAVDLA